MNKEKLLAAIYDYFEDRYSGEHDIPCIISRLSEDSLIYTDNRESEVYLGRILVWILGLSYFLDTSMEAFISEMYTGDQTIEGTTAPLFYIVGGFLARIYPKDINNLTTDYLPWLGEVMLHLWVIKRIWIEGDIYEIIELGINDIESE